MFFCRIVRRLVAVGFLGLGLSSQASSRADLSNHRIELVVDAAKSRIVRLALPGGNNLLWTTRDPEVVGDWRNWGGDKLWWAPQIDWRRAMPPGWPPDTTIDGPWQLLAHAPTRALMQSPVSPWAGIRARREISLASDAPHVVIRNSFLREAAKAQRVSLWSITQLQMPQWCWLEARPRPGEEPYVNLRRHLNPRPYVRFEPENGCIRVTPTLRERFMVGTRGSWLAAVYPDVVVVQRVSPYPDGQYAEHVSLQLFSCEFYTELETLGGLRNLAVGETVSNLVEWWILPRPAGLSEAGLNAWIRAHLAAEAPPQLQPEAGAEGQ